MKRFLAVTFFRNKRLNLLEASVRGNTSNSEPKNPATEPWEAEVIRLCQKGQKEPFAQLVDHYKNWIFGLIFRWVGQKEVAEEMAQEVFLKAFSQIRNFRGEARFSSWLYQISLNRCRDYWRSREFRHRQDAALEEIAERPALSPLAEQEIQLKQRQKIVRGALESLPENYREALILRYLHELSYEEMAEQLGQGVSSLKMRVMRGLDLLKNKLGDRDDG
jgi:RNA polymerase sigma-70 factor (ECF subfamily)